MPVDKADRKGCKTTVAGVSKLHIDGPTYSSFVAKSQKFREVGTQLIVGWKICRAHDIPIENTVCHYPTIPYQLFKTTNILDTPHPFLAIAE